MFTRAIFYNSNNLIELKPYFVPIDVTALEEPAAARLQGVAATSVKHAMVVNNHALT